MSEAKTSFFPSVPIFDKKFFFGRKNELKKITQALTEPGQSIFIYGERGIGKTSLVNMLVKNSPNQTIVRISCNRNIEKFDDLMKEIFRQMKLEFDITKIIQHPNPNHFFKKLLETDYLSINNIISFFTKLKNKFSIIIDEMDLFPNQQNNYAHLADFIKGISDNCPNLTLIFVGIYNSINELMKKHESLMRCLVELSLNRMKDEEINEIIEKGVHQLNMRIAPEVKTLMINYSKGFPYFTHMLAKFSLEDALALHYNTIMVNNLNNAIQKTIDNSNESLKNLFSTLVKNTKNQNYKKLVYLSALLDEHYQDEVKNNHLFKSNSLKYFTTADIFKLSHHYYPDFNLKKIQYCLNRLSQTGEQKIFNKTRNLLNQIQFSFKNPLFQTFVLLNYYNEGNEKLKIYT